MSTWDPDDIRDRERSVRKRPAPRPQATKPGVIRITTSKIVESIISTMRPILEGARVLDLFAGDGTLGLACFKEGAAHVTFIEGHPRVADRLTRALETKAAGNSTRVIRGLLPDSLPLLEEPYHVILADPPYGSAEGPPTMLRVPALLHSGGMIAWEHHHKDIYPQELPGCESMKVRRFGETAVTWFRKL